MTIITPRKMTWPSVELTWIRFTQDCFAPSLVEIGPVVLQEISLHIINEFSLCYYHLPFIWKKPLNLFNQGVWMLCPVVLERMKCKKFKTILATYNRQISIRKTSIRSQTRWPLICPRYLILNGQFGTWWKQTMPFFMLSFLK